MKQIPQHRTSPSRRLARMAPLGLAGLLVAALTLGACSKQDEEPTVGQQIDSSIATAEQKAADAKASMEASAKQAQSSMADATASMADTVKDAAITTTIKAELAKDSSLSALDIEVDTEAGKVVLKGTAPTAMARDRAYTLASAVDGVVAVDNELAIVPK